MKPVLSMFMLLIAALLAVTPAPAQRPENPRVPRQEPAPIPDMSNAFETRQMLQELLRQYPPFLSEVFQLDPSLMTNEGFLAAYPNLTTFLEQHPEVVRNPGFFVGNAYRGGRPETPEQRSQELMQSVIAGIAVFVAAFTFLTVLCWVLKTIIDHRRWLRVSRIQSEVHAKILDRFASNQDLLAYMQTSAGRNFLESAPISTEPPSRIGAPMNRILLSTQAGVILAFGGLGLHLVSRTLDVWEIGQPLSIVGGLAIALGTGFVLSALVAYVLSRRLGLLNQAPLSSTSDNPGVPPPHA